MRFVAFFALAALLTAHAWLYLPFVVDDALISMRYAERLVAGHGLTWTDGERVEGYSNLLWVLLLAGWRALGGDLVLGGRVLGLLCSLLALAAVVTWPVRPSAERPVAHWLPGAFVAASGPIAVWSVGGLEQSLLIALLVWALWLLARPARGPRDEWAAGALLGLLCWTRPDGPSFAVASAAAVGWAAWRQGGRGRVRDSVLRVLLPPALLVATQLAFRRLYYHDWLPNTAYVKIGLTLERVEVGLVYVGYGLVFMLPLLLLAGAAAWACWRRNERRDVTALVLASLFTWCAYVVAVGGDVLPAWRQLVPVAPLGALLVANGRACWEAPRSREAWLATQLVALLAFLPLQLLDPQNRGAAKQDREWDAKRIAAPLVRAFAADPPLIAVDAAGSLPFWTGFPSLDMLGLADRFIARHRPKDFGKGIRGHELGNGRYVLGRQPDIVSFGAPPGSLVGVFRGGIELQSQPEFLRDYVPVLLRARVDPPLIAPLWFRFDSPRVGVASIEGGGALPAYLLQDEFHRVGAGMPVALTEWSDADQALVLRMAPGSTVLRRGLSLRPGAWEAEPSLAGAPVASGLVVEVAEASGAPLSGGPPPLRFSVPGGGGITLRLSVRGDTDVVLSEVVLTQRGQ
ncbi:MAG: hypothetical protein AAF628_02285 [Planctomycetota bacterium]